MTPTETSDCKLDALGVIRCTALLCHVRMFKPQFAPLVESGAKCQTVRPTPKRMPKAGDRISLRMWTGKPYRSKQRVLREAIITDVGYVDMNQHGVAVNSVAENVDHFAQADGFSNWEELRDWFAANHGLPFEGVVIKWHNDEVSEPGDRQAGNATGAQSPGSLH